MQERGCHEPPPVAVRNPDRLADVEAGRQDVAAELSRRGDEDAVDVNRSRGGVHPGALEQLGQVDEHVDRNQHPGDDPRLAATGRPRDAGLHPGDALRLPGMLGTSLSDRRRGHALRADRPAAFRARDVGLSVRVPVAPHRGGHGSLA